MLLIILLFDQMIEDIDNYIQRRIDNANIELLHQIHEEESENQPHIHEEEEENQRQTEAQCLFDEREERRQQEAIQMEADLRVVADEEERN